MPRLPDGRLIITAQETALIHELAAMEERTLRVIDAMRAERLVDEAAYDPRWLAIATTHIQEAYSAMGKAIYRLPRLVLPEDVVDVADELPGEDQFDEEPVPGEDPLTDTVEGDPN